MTDAESSKGIQRCDEPDCRAWAHEVVVDIDHKLCKDHGRHFSYDEKVSINEWEERHDW